jgi:putative flippase GtrA
VKSSKTYYQLGLYFIVGAGATVVEWVVFYLLDVILGMHYVPATTLAFAVSTLANWGLGRMLVFKTGDPRGIIHELISIYGVSIIGLLANIVIMYACIEFLKTHDMIAKIIATGIVFLGNFVVRKFWIYKV